MKPIRTLPILLIILLAACATVPPPPVPESEQSSLIGMALVISSEAYQPDSPSEVLFIRLEEGDKSYLSVNEVIRSHYAREGQYYLLNAKPGRYIAVAACSRRGKGKGDGGASAVKQMYYLPLKVMQLSDVSLKEGEAAFMGKYMVHLPSGFKFSTGLANPDEAQSFYCKRFQPDQLVPGTDGYIKGVIKGIVRREGDAAHAVKLQESHKDAKSEMEFWQKAKDHFRGDSRQRKEYGDIVEKNQVWLKIIDRHLDKLKGR